LKKLVYAAIALAVLISTAIALLFNAPAPPNALIERMFLRGLPDDVILTRDLHTFDLPADSDEIRITEP
jgi:hypothetical protein